MKQHWFKLPGTAQRMTCAGILMLASLWIASIVVSPSSAWAQAATQKSVSGRVLGDGDKPIAGAIVYLQDGRTNNIRSFVSVSDGGYRFGQLSKDTDYQVWAGYQGKKSAVKTISSFDAKKQLILDLHLK